MQFLPTTWEQYSKEVYGRVREQTPTRERYVAYKKIEKWLAEGKTAYQIALIWNGGTPVEKSGINKHGVAYNTKKYAHQVLAQIP